jgi:hypothetical protein
MSAVKRVVDGIPAKDGAGVTLTRVIGQPMLSDLDPFLLLDEFRSDSPKDYIAGFPDHPHRGFQTVTYMLAGRMRHKDNKGHSGVVGPGGVQWMHAGSGIVHSEMPEQDEGLMWGFQLWVNLPAKDKMSPAKYLEFDAHEIPEVTTVGATVRVVAGKLADGTEGPVKGIVSEPIYLDVRLDGSAAYTVPLEEGFVGFLYPYEGSIAVDGSDESYNSKQLVQLNAGKDIHVRAKGEKTSFLVIAGKPFREPIARYGPFVMNTNEEIRQAVEDYQAGRF